MYHGTKDYTEVKRFGRWKTDTTHDYLWEMHERQRGLSNMMVQADYELTAPSAKSNEGATPPKRKVRFDQEKRVVKSKGSEEAQAWLQRAGNGGRVSTAHAQMGCLKCGEGLIGEPMSQFGSKN